MNMLIFIFTGLFYGTIIIGCIVLLIVKIIERQKEKKEEKLDKYDKY